MAQNKTLSVGMGGYLISGKGEFGFYKTTVDNVTKYGIYTSWGAGADLINLVTAAKSIKPPSEWTAADLANALGSVSLALAKNGFFLSAGAQTGEIGGWNGDYGVVINGVGVSTTFNMNSPEPTGVAVEVLIPPPLFPVAIGGSLYNTIPIEIYSHALSGEERVHVSIGSVSSARIPGEFGPIPVGNETNALDVISEANSRLAPNCFAAGTSIRMADGADKAIEHVTAGDIVLAFGSARGCADQPLEARKVARIFNDLTEEWLRLYPVGTNDENFVELIVTPGHHFLASDGTFRRVDQILADDACIVLADGSVLTVAAKRIVYSAQTAHLYEEAQIVECASVGGLALTPQIRKGWKTYNFEVESLHTYIAGGARVHNRSAPTLAITPSDAANALGHEYNHSQSDFNMLMQKVASGDLSAHVEYVDSESNDRYTAPFDNAPSKIVISGDENGSTVSTVSSGFLQHITSLPVDGMRIDTAFAPDGSRLVTTTDVPDFYGWDHEVKSIHPDGLFDNIVVGDNGAVASASWNGGALAGDFGQMFGSQLGRLLGGDDPFKKLAAGTVMGAISKEVGKAMFMSGTFSLDVAVKDAFGTLGGGAGVGSLPGAAIGAISSLLMSEFADAIDLHGFAGGLFTTVGTTLTTQLITNAYGVATGAYDDGGNGNPITMATGFDAASIATNLGTLVAAKLASTLASQIVIPHYQEGAIGQQVGSSVGAFLRPIEKAKRLWLRRSCRLQSSRSTVSQPLFLIPIEQGA